MKRINISKEEFILEIMVVIMKNKEIEELLNNTDLSFKREENVKTLKKVSQK